MRSSVSYILSSSTTEPLMSHPDYEQYSHDHAALLVLVRQIGAQLKPKTFTKFYDRIAKINHVKITDSTGQNRNILVRYVREHPVQNNDWGDFQTHRRLIGLISLGKYDSQVELNEICRVHESLKVKYTNTLYDSRCILLRPSTDLDSPNEGSDDVSSATTSSADTSLSEGFNSAGFKEDPLTTEPTTEQRHPQPLISHRDKVEKLVEKLRESETVPTTVTAKPNSKFTTPSNFKTRALFYTDSDPCVDLESTLTEYVNSLFWVLDSKRLERSREKLERVPLLLAPFEKKDFVGLDLESRNNRRRCTGRVTKNLGDLCLQAGLVTECLAHYSTAVEILRGVNDWLWLGGAWEGWCAASGLVLYPEMGRGGGGSGGLQRNASLQEGGKERVTTVTVVDNLQSRITSPTLVVDTLTNTVTTPLVLQPEDISRRYREAIIHYSKYQNAGIVETEASFKAARIAVAQQHPLQAASFLQNVVFINLTLSEQEKIQRFETLAGLYEEIGFQRKAAFCRRLAATRYVSPSNTTPNWSECYALMLHSFTGHKLSLDPAEMYAEAAAIVGAAGHGGQQVGWPALQIQLLSELVVAAKRMGHSALATRHMTFLLQTMWPHLTPADQREFSVQLQSLSAQCEGAPVPLVLDSGLVIPPANLTNIPVCVGFTIKNLQPHLKPRKIQTEVADIGPFLFTPINFGSLERNNNGGKPNSKMDFLWVENDPCEVVLRLINPLPCELKVSNVRLLTGGVVFESLPETVTLPPGGGGGGAAAAAGGDSSPTASSLTLHGTPREAGELELLGYSTHTLGVKSNCRLRHMAAVAAAATRGAPTLHPSPAHQLLPLYTVTVIPALPTAALFTSLPPLREVVFRVGGEDVVTSASTVLYQGEQGLCTVSLTNTSDIDITLVEITLTAGVTGTNDMFSWSDEELERQLPLSPHHTMTVTVTITSGSTSNNNNSGGGFLANHHSNHNNNSTINSNCQQLVGSAAGGGYASLVSVTSSSLSLVVGGGSCGGGPSSLPSRLNSPVMSMSSESGSTTISTVSTARRGGATAAGNIVTTARSAVTEAQLQFKYSGSLGQLADYCRTSSVYLTVEVLPSLHVTNWDVLPAEVSTQFYLVLDVVNLTPHEMEVQYTPHKHMVVSGEETCRVPIPVERCPLTTTSSSNSSQQQQPSATSDHHHSDDSCGGVVLVDDDIHRSRACASHVTRLVQLQWRLGEGGGRRRVGKASLEGLTLTPAMVDVVRMSPVVWEVSVNKCRVKPTEAILCDIGNCLEVEISVRNSLEVALDELSVTVHFYQDYQNGVCNYNLETRLAMTGPNKFLIDRLEPEAIAKHSCNVFIFTPGQYKMDIQCCSNGNTANNHQLPLQQPSQQQQQVWKFIPAIEVNVAAA